MGELSAFAGKIPSTTDPALKKYFDELISINQGEVELEKALATAGQNLTNAVEQIGNLYAIGLRR